MPVVKSKLQTHYFIYPNSVAQSELSLEAKGLIAYMSSKPDDWVFHKEVIKTECKIGRDKLNTLYNELINGGHLAVTQIHDQDGKFSRNETMFFVEPANNPAFVPCTDLPLTDLPYTAKQQLQSKDINKVKNNTNINTSLVNDGFSFFWKHYPRKEGKVKAESKFKTLVKKMTDEELCAFVDLITNDCQLRYKDTEKKFIPHGSKYMNQEIWQDEL